MMTLDPGLRELAVSGKASSQTPKLNKDLAPSFQIVVFHLSFCNLIECAPYLNVLIKGSNGLRFTSQRGVKLNKSVRWLNYTYVQDAVRHHRDRGHRPGAPQEPPTHVQPGGGGQVRSESLCGSALRLHPALARVGQGTSHMRHPLDSWNIFLSPVCTVQGSPKRWSPVLVNFVPAVAYHLCLALPAVCTQPGACLLAEPCIWYRFRE